MNIKWNGEGLPPVGTVCEYSVHGGAGTRFWCKVLFVGHTYVVLENAEGREDTDIVTCINFHPIKTDKENWVDKVMQIYRTCDAVSVPDAMGDIYDALASGKIPMPKVTK